MRISVLSQNALYGAGSDGRWEGLVGLIRGAGPDLVMLQEVDWLADPREVERAEAALGMRVQVAPSNCLPVAVCWNPAVLSAVGVETKYARSLHHGYCAVRFDIGIPEAPLVAVSTHLTPYSAAAAAQEAQLVGTRVARHGQVGFVAGDINHMPLGDPEPDWDLVQPYNRMSRCLRRAGEDEPWRGDRIVGATLRDGDLVDVAGFLADQRADDSLRAPTGRHGGVRVDQAHVTMALRPAIRDYRRIDPGEFSDHFGIWFTLDLDDIDRTCIRAYT